MSAWAARLAERRAHGKTDKTRPEAGVLSVLAVLPRASGAEPEAIPADPFLRWRLENSARLTADDLARGFDAGGYCTVHGRILSYPEQKRGACSWCVPVAPDHESEYWASHWRRFTERP